MPDNQTKAIVGAAVAVGAAAGLAYLYTKNSSEPIPTKWKKVGHVIDLNCYPIKSCAPIKRQSFDCHILGFEHEGLFDRGFVIAQKNKQVTARAYPKLVLIQVQVVDGELILCAPGMPNIAVNLNELRNRPIDFKVELWASKMKGIDVGDAVGDWISEFIVGKSGAFRLIFYPHLYPVKPKLSCDVPYKAFKNGDVGAFHDDTSYMLINQASMDELNSHLDHLVKPLQFRPSIVINGPKAYEEDNFKWIRIGDTIFRGLRPCTRCIFTNINPETGERHPDREPLETLIKNRTIIPNESPVMGLHAALRQPGKISIGDEVYINDDEN